MKFHLPFKSLHSSGVLLYRDSQDAAALVLHHMAVALGVLMGSDVIGIAVVGADMIEPVGSYLYVQQPWLEVYNDEVAGQQLLHDYPKQSQCY